jgi:hypothetical protein
VIPDGASSVRSDGAATAPWRNKCNAKHIAPQNSGNSFTGDLCGRFAR